MIQKMKKAVLLICILLLLAGCSKVVDTGGYTSVKFLGGWRTYGPSAVSPDGKFEALLHCSYKLDVHGELYNLYIYRHDASRADLPAHERFNVRDFVTYYGLNSYIECLDSDGGQSIEEYIPHFGKIEWLSNDQIQYTPSGGNFDIVIFNLKQIANDSWELVKTR